MAILLDTGIVYAGYDRRDRWHAAARDLLHAEARELILPTPTIPEIDHLLGKHLGSAAQRTFLESLTDGTFFLADLPTAGYRRAAELDRRYADLRLGFVDAAVMAIAEDLGVGRIATLDRRHFGTVELEVQLTLLPASS
jgi:predicted nucleic acid-binding protein